MITEQRRRLNKELKLLLIQKKRRGSSNFSSFVTYTKEDYSMQWFHDVVCEYLDKLSRREIKKLMIFMPPQHGKTELSSRRFPAYLLGKNPKEKIILGSYNQTKASEFVTDCNRIMLSDSYKELFPDTKLNGKQRAEYFEVNMGEGFLKGAGMDSGVTGTTATGIIIDDPFKGRNEANSETQRNRTWNTYSDDFQTRLSNDGFQLFLFTKWHEDDIAGRILDPNNEFYDEEEAKEWTVISFPALKESVDPIYSTINVEDPREIDEALWEERHSRAKYIKRRRINPTGFASLDQQRPSALEGNKIRKDWFNIIKEKELPFNPEQVQTEYFIDGAFTDSSKNDETGLLSCHFDKKLKHLYIYNCTGIRKELYEFLPFFKKYAESNYLSNRSIVNIEPKASGKPMKSMLSKVEYGGFNVKEVLNKTVRLGKWNRVENIEPFLASGKVFLVQGSWNRAFMDQCASFPNATNDDMLDVLCYAVLKFFMEKRVSVGASGIV